jgi:hypothetical protein
MVKSGDKIIAKSKFLTQYNIPYEYREVEVLDCDGVTISVTNEYIRQKLKGYVTTFFDPETQFYLSNNINYEIVKLIEQGVEFKEFNAVTIDNKIIDIRMGLKR